MTRVLILSEVGVYREALAKSVGRDGRIEVVGVAANLDDAIAAVENGRIEIFLVDTPMPRGADAVQALTAAAPEVKTVALGVPETERDVVALAEAGASGYVARDASIEDLVATVDCVSRGEVLCPPEVAATLFRRVGMLARERGPEPIGATLTARQLDVLRLIEEGRSNKEIAKALSIELPTVKNHVHRILEKLDVHTRTEAAALARRHGVAHLGRAMDAT
jgi:DNA-binding NarL/FixJ family response regulator